MRSWDQEELGAYLPGGTSLSEASTNLLNYELSFLPCPGPAALSLVPLLPGPHVDQ